MPFVRMRGVEGGTGPFGRPLAIPFVVAEPLGGAEEDEGGVTVDPLTFDPEVAPVRCGEDDMASSPTRLRLLSALGFSGASLIVERAGVDPNPGDW